MNPDKHRCDYTWAFILLEIANRKSFMWSNSMMENSKKNDDAYIIKEWFSIALVSGWIQWWKSLFK